ncbi:MAG TPA: hypothetical protein PLN21_07650 [Gemmatales bacterium]|nr:hypothetical protein [Gemmatales bacterium]
MSTPATEPRVKEARIERQTTAKTLGQIWGLVGLAALFGMGGYRLLKKGYLLTSATIAARPGYEGNWFDWACYGIKSFLSSLFNTNGNEPTVLHGIPITAFDWFLFGLIILLGVGKGYAIFYRKMVPRTLARCRTALGETGWSMDYVLAPFCMLSLYRPWKRKHAILSWIVVPVMVMLAVSFILWVPDSVFKAAVDWAVGGALAFAALLYVFNLLRLLGWLATGAKFEKHPFPANAD